MDSKDHVGASKRWDMFGMFEDSPGGLVPIAEQARGSVGENELTVQIGFLGLVFILLNFFLTEVGSLWRVKERRSRI